MFYRGVYTRDDGGRLAEKTETIGGVATVEAYSYDLAGRLTGVARGGAPVAGYSYDLNGNRTSVTTPAGTAAATYDEQDRILTLGGRTYTHTVHGEVASWTEAGATTTLSYDVQGNLLAVGLPTGTLVQYEVDGRNRRLRRLVNGVATHGFLYQGQLHPIAELDGAGTLVSRFVYGARAVAPEYLIRAGVSYRLVTDHLGSVRLVVNTTSGAIIQRLDYDAYGKVTLDTNPGFQPFGYAGGLYDPLTGFVRFGVRDYDPATGRWLSAEPLGFESGNDINRFVYVRSDPINRVDINGLWSISASLYTGLGGGISFGQNPTGRFFLTFRYGSGAGGGISFDVDGKSPGYAAAGCGPVGVSMGVFAQAGYSVAYATGQVGVQAGITAEPGQANLYLAATAKLLQRNIKNFGLSFGASAGVEVGLR